MTLISVVSGTFQRLLLLQRMVASARASVPAGIPLEFVIVDGGSTDGTIDWCLSQPDVRLIQHGELRGAIPAFCDGAKAAHGRYVILANDDVLFRQDSIFRAMLYLETHLKCGAVAFADNRPAFGKTGYQVMGMAATRNGKPVTVAYAQVGMFRRWLGNDVGWWGADDSTFPARTYAGDNYLSSGIWQRGYTVDAVPGVEVDDMVYEDDLRKINGSHRPDGSHPDSEAYFARYPSGAAIPDAPVQPNPDSERLRILYLPVYEPGHAVQKHQKHGLRDALAEVAWTVEVDFLSINPAHLFDTLKHHIQTFKPHMVLSQIQAPEPLTDIIIRQVRALDNSLVWVNWNGDYAPGGLTSPAMLDILRWTDLQLCINGSVLPVYAQQGIPAAYWQIGFEEPGDISHIDTPPFDVTFLANAYTEGRKNFGRLLQFWSADDGFTLGLYGSGWENPAGFNLYDFASGKAIYRASKIALGDNQFPDAPGFVSNRLFQSLAAGNTLVMHQHVPDLEALTGLANGVHYIVWTSHEDLREKLRYFLTHETERRQIADAGTAFVYEKHSFKARVNELFKHLLPLAKRRPREFVTLHYTGTRTKPFGVPGYGQYTPGEALRLPAEDARMLLLSPELWHKVESEMG